MQILDKLKLGSIVQINLDLLEDRLSKETIEAINKSAKGTISDFKITDGKGIGVILKLSNGKEQWFFEHEIEIIDDNGNIIKKEEDSKLNNTFFNDVFKNLNYYPENKINKLLNPINFIVWLISSLKDIF